MTPGRGYWYLKARMTTIMTTETMTAPTMRMMTRMTTESSMTTSYVTWVKQGGYGQNPNSTDPSRS